MRKLLFLVLLCLPCVTLAQSAEEQVENIAQRIPMPMDCNGTEATTIMKMWLSDQYNVGDDEVQLGFWAPPQPPQDGRVGLVLLCRYEIRIHGMLTFDGTALFQSSADGKRFGGVTFTPRAGI